MCSAQLRGLDFSAYPKVSVWPGVFCCDLINSLVLDGEESNKYVSPFAVCSGSSKWCGVSLL